MRLPFQGKTLILSPWFFNKSEYGVLGVFFFSIFLWFLGVDFFGGTDLGFFGCCFVLFFGGSVEVMKPYLRGSFQNVSRVHAKTSWSRNSMWNFLRIDILCLLNYKITESWTQKRPQQSCGLNPFSCKKKKKTEPGSLKGSIFPADVFSEFISAFPP